MFLPAEFLIHLGTAMLQEAYKKIYEASTKYVCMVEYYNPTPVGIDYGSHKDKLYKRYFAGEFMDIYPDTRLVDYGFIYRRDP